MLRNVTGMLVIGLVAGLLARLAVRGRQRHGLVGTVAVGFVGSLIGGFIGYALFHHERDEGVLQHSGRLDSWSAPRPGTPGGVPGHELRRR